MRALLTLLFFTAVSACFAQKQNIYFLKNDGQRVDLLYSADFIRVISEADPGTVLYNVNEFYKSGKRKLVGKSSTVDIPVFEGQVISFFENGKRSAIRNYKYGELINDQYEYFPNGKLYIVKRYSSTSSGAESDFVVIAGKTNKPFTIVSNFDSLGTALITDRDGYFKAYDNSFKEIKEEGPVVNGKKDSIWKGVDGKIHFIEIYRDGKFISGKASNEVREVKDYTQREVAPRFWGGMFAFGSFLADNIKYPKHDSGNYITGTVILQFVVEKDGRIRNIKAVRSPTPAMAAESIRVLSASPKWEPGFQYGFPVRTPFTASINFNIN
jgi:antitoxin component YwqK of YwqJK toxin-antitoxin module